MQGEAVFLSSVSRGGNQLRSHGACPSSRGSECRARSDPVSSDSTACTPAVNSSNLSHRAHFTQGNWVGGGSGRPRENSSWHILLKNFRNCLRIGDYYSVPVNTHISQNVSQRTCYVTGQVGHKLPVHSHPRPSMDSPQGAVSVSSRGAGWAGSVKKAPRGGRISPRP